jgi:hypothetical protein
MMRRDEFLSGLRAGIKGPPPDPIEDAVVDAENARDRKVVERQVWVMQRARVAHGEAPDRALFEVACDGFQLVRVVLPLLSPRDQGVILGSLLGGDDDHS